MSTYRSKKDRLRLSYNSPAVLTFVLICVAVHLVRELTGDWATIHLFSVYGSSLLDPLTWIRLFGHAIGHASWEHLLNNMMFLLILGPMIEEKYGTSNTVFVMVATALVTGIVNMIFFPHVRTLGASGIVFAFILLASITGGGERTIPLTFILVAILYIGEQVYTAVTAQDSISQISHIAGGLVGSVLGFLMKRWRMNGYRQRP
jgi:GlpG protein